ncbi:MAG: molybdopterin-dependent oxidoreductase, partial [Deltaproteobacteria bacterium]|nr:molybdopterin-dependent oxidoreductase [Deltaproteobacteria bacterium]
MKWSTVNSQSSILHELPCVTSLPVTVQYLLPHEEIVPGHALWYASTCRECPAGCGLLVKTREGRAIKVEGNPQHPVNRGRLCARGQASLQGLYNPDRIREPLRKDPAGRFQPIAWEEAEKLLAENLDAIRGRGFGHQVAFITAPLTGSLDRLISDWLKGFGSKRLIRYEPFAYEPLRAANRICFDRDVVPTYHLAEAKLILSFGADFLEGWISPVEFAQGFSKMRRPDNGGMGRFIYVGPRLSLTAANADEWISPRPGSEPFLALGMIHVILGEGLAASLPQEEREEIRRLTRAYDPKTVAARTEIPPEQIVRLARVFSSHGPALALAGGVAVTDRNATATGVAINLLNYISGNLGKTIRFGPTSNLSGLNAYRDLISLIEAMSRGEIQAVFLYNVNPLFTMPRAAGFDAALKKVPLVVSFSGLVDETAAEAHLVLPDHASLESWGDYSPQEGIHSLMQPAMRPLFNTRGLGDLLINVAKRMEGGMAQSFPWGNFYEYLRDQWKKIHQQVDPRKEFESFWEESLQRGGLWGGVRPGSARLNLKAVSSLKSPIGEAMFDGDGTFYLSLYPSLSHFDGRGANRPWLQELPDPMTSIVWDNWLEIHPQTAKRFQITEGDLISISSPYGKAELPAHLSEGIRPDVVAVPIGQGHTKYGRYASDRGANPIHLLPHDPEPQSGALPWLSVKVTLNKTGKRYPLASVAGSDRQYGRGIAQAVSVAALSPPGEVAEGAEEEPKQIYPP